MYKRVINWCRLLRLPNLFTVPGDAIMGHVIAEGGMRIADALPAAGVTLCLYCYGLVGNDLNDVEEDRTERPGRPLASGAVSLKAARAASCAFLFGGLAGAWFIGGDLLAIALVLALLISLYNRFLKHSPFFGPLCLGVCRALSIVCGYVATGAPSGYLKGMLHLCCAAWVTYFFSVSVIAREETRGRVPLDGLLLLCTVPLIWLVGAPFMSMCLVPVILLRELNPSLSLALASSLIFSLIVVTSAVSLSRQKRLGTSVPATVGRLILAAILLQAAGCAFVGYPHIALFVFLLYIPAALSAKFFYSS